MQAKQKGWRRQLIHQLVQQNRNFSFLLINSHWMSSMLLKSVESGSGTSLLTSRRLWPSTHETASYTYGFISFRSTVFASRKERCDRSLCRRLHTLTLSPIPDNFKNALDHQIYVYVYSHRSPFIVCKCLCNFAGNMELFAMFSNIRRGSYQKLWNHQHT
jgi:hypothetical protein